MVSSVVSNPTERLVTHRVDEDVELRDDASYTRKSRSKVVRRVLATVVVLCFLVGVSVLSYFVVTKYKSISEFKSGLSDHLSKSFPELEMKKRDHYFDELTFLFRSGLISQDPRLELEVYMAFESFNIKYQRVYRYLNDRRDKFVNFRNSYLEVKDQKGDKLYTKGINRFSDLSEEEFFEMFPPIKAPRHERLPPSDHSLNLLANPTYLKHLKMAKNTTEDLDLSKVTGEDLDWRRAKTVSEVKDQGDCGGCWSFATVGSVESFYLTHKDKAYHLSEQELLDCDQNSFGCNGGFPESALHYVANYGLVSSKDLPFVGFDKKCSVPNVDKVMIDEYYIFKGKNVLNKSLVVAPTVVLMGVTPEFTKYQSGLYDGPCAKNLNHAVLLVGEGYDPETKRRYWVVKNSWGTDWGEEGFFRLERTNKGTDKCGILDTGLYPFAY